MVETNKQSARVTHVWPYSKIINPEAQPFSNEREADVWDELRDLTLDEDVWGKYVWHSMHLNHDAMLTL